MFWHKRQEMESPSLRFDLMRKTRRMNDERSEENTRAVH